MTSLADSYRHCTRISRARAKNFYYSFLLLPKQKRLSMCAIYAFMRECDDLSDGPRASADALGHWRLDLDQTLAGTPAAHPLWPAFLDTVTRYHIPHRYFHEMIDGVAGDLAARSFETFDDLYRYCYLVASVVGLTIIHVFEFSNPAALPLAEKCGIAFQLTNILRDVAEDRDNGRVYLPAEDLRRFGVSDLHHPSPELSALLRFEGARAHALYQEARPLLDLVHEDSRAALWALMEIYRRLLNALESSGYEVLSRRIGLSTPHKLTILAQAFFRS
jgi:phytoene synthase